MTADSLFKSLGIPDNTFNPTDVLSKRLGDWNVILSPRATGKTTNLLLWGMCHNQTDGTVIQYIRQYDDMLTPSTISELLNMVTLRKSRAADTILLSTGGGVGIIQEWTKTAILPRQPMKRLWYV